MANELSFTQAAALAELFGRPARNREADRARYPNPWFNNWLDEQIAENGMTVWDTLTNTNDAYGAWCAAGSMFAQKEPEKLPVAVPDMQVPVFLAPKTVYENVQPQNLTTEELTMMLRMFFEEENYYMVVEKPDEGPWSYSLARRTT